MKKGCLIKGSIIVVALLCILGFAAFTGIAPRMTRAKLSVCGMLV